MYRGMMDAAGWTPQQVNQLTLAQVWMLAAKRTKGEAKPMGNPQQARSLRHALQMSQEMNR